MTTNNQPRIFVINGNRILEDKSTTNLTNEQVRKVLARAYPEVANATIRETTSTDGQRIVTFLPQPGRKG